MPASVNTFTQGTCWLMDAHLNNSYLFQMKVLYLFNHLSFALLLFKLCNFSISSRFSHSSFLLLFFHLFHQANLWRSHHLEKLFALKCYSQSPLYKGFFFSSKLPSFSILHAFSNFPSPSNVSFSLSAE